jgi:beta-1,4-mannosyltransferase
MLSSRTKHVLHCGLFLSLIGAFEVFTGGIRVGEFSDPSAGINPWEQYGLVWTVVLYSLRLLALLSLPQVHKLQTLLLINPLAPSKLSNGIFFFNS